MTPPLSHPPVDFPLYGLATSDLPRWLDFTDGRLGDSAWGVWLRHGTRPELTPQEPWARVGSLHRERFGRAMLGAAGDAVREVAAAAMFALVNNTFPGPTGRPDDYARRVVVFADREADRHAEWTPVSWTVGGDVVPARMFEFAGAWTGFTTALPEVDVVVVAAGIDPGTLVLAEVVDTSPYHFAVDRPIDLAEVAARGMSAALGVDAHYAADASWPLHPDQVRAVS